MTHRTSRRNVISIKHTAGVIFVALCSQYCLLEKGRISYGIVQDIIFLCLQIFNAQNCIIFKISASGLILKFQPQFSYKVLYKKDCNFVSNHISIETLSWNLLFELLAWEANITACELLKLLYRSMLRTRLRFQKLNMQKTKMRSSINLTLNWIHVVSTTLFDSIVLKISQTLAFRS